MARPKKINVPTADAAQTDIADFVTTPSAIVAPSIQVEGKKNVLCQLFDGDPAKIPVLRSVGYAEVPGTNTFIAYTIHSKGREIVKIEVEEPNLRAIAEESAKIFFVNTFMMGEPDVQM